MKECCKQCMYLKECIDENKGNLDIENGWCWCYQKDDFKENYNSYIEQ